MKQQRSTPLVPLTIEASDRFAWMHLLAAFVWGGNKRKMDHALATYSSEFLGIWTEWPDRRKAPVTVAAVAKQVGVEPEELLRMPRSAAFAATALSDPQGARRTLDAAVFKPAGHFRSVAEAPGSIKLLEDYENAANGGAMLAGTVLLLTAIMAQHHPDLPASQSRSIEIIESMFGRGEMAAFSGRTIKHFWKEWRHVAPLWAAVTGNIQIMQQQGFTPHAAGIETLQSPESLGRVIAHAKWFHEFATTFIPARGQGPIIDPKDVVAIISSIPAEAPPLARLRPVDVKAARAYRAPTVKYHPDQ